MKKYLIFDLDWTLIKSNKMWLENVLHYIKKYDNNYLEKARYIFTTTPWMPLIEQLKLVFDEKIDFNLDNAKKLTKKIYKRIRKKQDEVEYFKWVPEKIREISKNYKLFLTTWNSTKFAKEILETWDIKDCFELIYWSNEIKKWSQHLSIFKNYSEDENFFANSIYFWDWEMDKIFAKEAWIDFVRIWDFKEENHVLDSVAKIDKILKLFN